MFHTGPSPARFARALADFVGEAVWPLRGRGAWPMTWRLRGARLWAGMAWGARRMQKVLDGDPTHAIGLEGRLASSIAWCASRGSTSMRLVNRKRRTLCGGLPGCTVVKPDRCRFLIVLFGE